MRPDIKQKAIELAKIFRWKPSVSDRETPDDKKQLYIREYKKDPTGKKFNVKYKNELAREYSSLSYLINKVLDKCRHNMEKVSTVNNTNDMKLILLDSLLEYYKSIK